MAETIVVQPASSTVVEVVAPTSANVIEVSVPTANPVITIGVPGMQGPPGALTVGTVTTGAAGSNASISVRTLGDGTQVADFTIPRGATGSTGLTGPANTLAIGTVTTGAPGSSAIATITGAAPTQTLNLTIPQGTQGPTGAGAPDATTTTKGSIQLAGDLGGTAAAPTVPGLAGKANTTHSHVATDISNSTAIGRTVLTAADATAVRTAIGAGTSSLAIGTTGTTAMAGNKTFTAANVGAVAKTGDTMTGALTLSSWQAGLAVNNTANAVVIPDPNNPLQDPFPAMYHDLLAFNRKWGAPVYETSADGTTGWTAATREDALFSRKEDQAFIIIDGTVVKGARWTWGSSASPMPAYATVSWLVIGHTYVDTFPNKEIKLETSVDGITWTTRHISTYSNVATPVWHRVTDWGGDIYIRLTIRSLVAGGAVNLSSIRMLSSRWGDQGGGSELEIPYTWDKNRSVTFERAYSNNATLPGPTELTRRDYVDAIGTTATTGDTIVRRDSNGQITGTRVFGTSATPVTAGELTRKDYVDAQVATRAATSHTHTAANISDATTIGRTVLTAADATAVRTAIGAGTSSLAIGTTSTTAKAGDYAPPIDGAVGTGTMRTLGTGALQAAAGNHTHTAANITDASATGRSVLTGADATAIRSTLGAGRVDSSDASILNVVKMTQAAYDALGTKVATTLYVIVG